MLPRCLLAAPQSLLESYSSQAGLAGPASNMLGMLGLGLPDDADGKGAKAASSGGGGGAAAEGAAAAKVRKKAG